MTTDALQLSSEGSYVRVTLEAASGRTALYTNWTSDLPGGFLATPTMLVKLPQNAAGLEATFAEIRMPTDEFLTWLSNGSPKPDVDVTIDEVVFDASGSAAARVIHHLEGKVIEIERNAGRRSNICSLKIATAKNMLDMPLGVPCNHQCPFTLFGGGCSVVASLYRSALVVTGISGYEVTVNTDPLKAEGWFVQGTILFDSTYLLIRGWDTDDPTKFRMARIPPPEMLGEAVSVYPGCDKTYATCRDKFANQRRFGGIGIGIPAWNPLYEQPLNL